jgi:phosphoglycerol transferase
VTSLRVLVYFLGFFAFGLAGWIHRTFGAPNIDQIVYHLRFAEGAAVEMSQIFVLTFAVEVVAFPLLFAIAAAALHAAVAQWQPAWRAHVLRITPAAAIAAGVGALLLQFSVFSYAAAYFGPDVFSAAYVDPHRTHIVPAKRTRNLVLIYVESLEATYGNREIFGTDLLAPLRGLGGWSFANYQPAPGATWTMGGIVASQCGVPLRVYSEYDVRRREQGKTFLPGARCLGDVLQGNGYANVFMGGAPLSFSGKGAFLTDHGYRETWGRDEWARQGVRDGELNEWGLYDGPLFDRALARLQQLHDTGKPFNLTVLTIDTHNPRGFLGPDCRSRGAKQFAEIVTCNAAQVAAFISQARARGLLANTVVAVLGDHLAVPNPVYDKLQAAHERTIFNLFLSDEVVALNRSSIRPFDLYPTLLELMGFEVENGRLGLGLAGVHHPQLASPPLDDIPLAALAGSAAYSALWRRRED